MLSTGNDLFVDMNLNNVFDEVNENDLFTPNASSGHKSFHFGYHNPINNNGINQYQHSSPSVFFFDEFSLNNPQINSTYQPHQHNSQPVDMNTWLRMENISKVIDSNHCIVDKSRKYPQLQPLLEEPKKKVKRSRKEINDDDDDYVNILSRSIIKGAWSEDEDILLMRLVTDELKIHQQIRWTAVSKKIKTRTPKQCRERWTLNLNPAINHNPFTAEDDAILMEAYNKLGPRWTKIKDLLPGRTENSVKTRYKSIMRKLNKKSRSRNFLQHQNSILTCMSAISSPISSYSSTDEYVC